MKKYDFRFDPKLMKSMIGKTFIKYKHTEFILTNSVTGIIGFEINDCVYQIINDYEALDYFTLDDEATVFRISKTKWDHFKPMINNDITETFVHEQIKKIVLVNDHTILKVKDNIEYDMWDTKAIIFYFKNYEICFMKQDLWFSQEIEIYKGHDLLEKTGDGRGILDDFDTNDSEYLSVERSFVEIE